MTPLVARLAPIAASDLSLSDLDRYQVREAVAFKVDPRDARVLVDGALRRPGGEVLRAACGAAAGWSCPRACTGSPFWRRVGGGSTSPSR